MSEVTESNDVAIFDTFGIEPESVTVSTGGIPVGKHKAKITDAKVRQGKYEDGNPFVQLVIDYTVDGYDFPKTEYLNLPTKPKAQWDETITGKDQYGKDQSEAITFGNYMRRYKQRLEAYGIPESAMSSVKPRDLVDLECVITVVERPGRGKNEGKVFNNISKVEKVGTNAGLVLPGAGSAPAGVPASLPAQPAGNPLWT